MARDWRELIDDAVASSRISDRAGRRSTALNYPPELYPFVLEAAKSRDLSIAAYQRRAVLSFAQWDLGFDWLTEMQAEPPVATFADLNRRSLLRGTGRGAWRILELGEFR